MKREIKKEVAEEVVRSCREHIKKHGLRKCSLKELKDLLGIKQCR